MQHRIELYAPRYDGERFKEHRLPLDLLEDLATLQEMTIEMAKFLYRKKNPDRERIPKNFTQGISFELENIQPGSTIPKIVLITTLSGLFPSANVAYFEEAKVRIIQAVQAADEGSDIHLHAPDNVLNYFNQLGKKLGNDEFIEFDPTGKQKAKFTKESRKKLILASSKVNEYTENTQLYGFISELDLNKKSFKLDQLNGQRIESQYHISFEKFLQEALISYTSNAKQRIQLKGTGKFNKSGGLIKLESVDDIIPLDEFDVPFRLEELSLLKQGWLNGDGEVLDEEGLDWLAENFDKQYDASLPLPATFPTPDGNIQFEWSIKRHEISLEVDLASHKGEYFDIDLNTRFTKENTIDLNTMEGWSILNSLIYEIENIIS